VGIDEINAIALVTSTRKLIHGLALSMVLARRNCGAMIEW